LLKVRVDTPASAAMSSIRTSSKPRSTVSRIAAQLSAMRVSCFLRSRSPARSVPMTPP
jgi:hypothetical protein